jgi:hypothetical protein
MDRVAYVIAGDVESANDAVQAAWAIAWQRLGSRSFQRIRPRSFREVLPDGELLLPGG